MPLFFGDRLIGMLTLDKLEVDFYTAEHAHLAKAFAAYAATLRFLGEASETQTGDSSVDANLLKLLVSKTWGFFALLPSFREYRPFGEQFAR